MSPPSPCAWCRTARQPSSRSAALSSPIQPSKAAYGTGRERRMFEFRSIGSALISFVVRASLELKAGPAGGLRPPSGPATTRRPPGCRPRPPAYGEAEAVTITTGGPRWPRPVVNSGVPRTITGSSGHHLPRSAAPDEHRKPRSPVDSLSHAGRLTWRAARRSHRPRLSGRRRRRRCCEQRQAQARSMRPLEFQFAP